MKLEEIKEFMMRYTNGETFNYKQMEYSTNRKLEILLEGTYKDYQFYILNLGTHPTAYIEIPRESKLFGKDYEQIYEMEIDVDVHGGLTFSGDYLQDIKENTWFIGWDYAHYGDYVGYEEIMPQEIRVGGKRWTTEEIFEDVVKAIEQIREYDLVDVIQEMKEVREKYNEED